ncbi:MAG TPA: nuclear transport factor 2 family protein [Kofleriaceae bacterium]|nr:nuclear transport factor 2 family protein [Kofleriaceae bacterium]
MFRMTLVAAVLALGCKQKPADEMRATPGSGAPSGASDDAGSAVGPTAIDAGTAPPLDTAPSAKTGDELAKRYGECITAATEARWDDYRRCYAPTVAFESPGLDEPHGLDVQVRDAQKTRELYPDHKQEPQLVLVSGQTIISILLVTGTHAKTKKPIGFYLANVVATDAQGVFVRDLAFWDAKTVTAQSTGKAGFRAVATGLPTKIALISKDDQTEKSNLALFAKMNEASESRDLVTFASFVADDVVWSVQNQATDLSKAEILAGIKTRLEKTDLHYKVDHVWAAGDYVATIETVTGSAPADSPDKKVKRGDKIDRQLLAIHRFAAGKLAQVWVFAQS